MLLLVRQEAGQTAINTSQDPRLKAGCEKDRVTSVLCESSDEDEEMRPADSVQPLLLNMPL